MSSFFISSVVTGFEDFRAAAKSAVELLLGKAIMSESFGVRPYSSEKACMLSIEQADHFILILGKNYGFETQSGKSVTQSEFEHAQKHNKKILIFIQRVEVDEKQAIFKKQVQDFTDGFYRETFDNESELKDKIISGIALLNASLNALKLEEFLGIIENANKQTRNYNSYESFIRICFLPQPIIQQHLPDLDLNANEYFQKMCSSNFSIMRDGYKIINEGSRESFMGIETKNATLKIYENSLTIIDIGHLYDHEHSFAQFAVSPSRVATLCKSAFNFIDATSVWVHVSLIGMENKSFKELNDNSNSIQISHGNPKLVSENKLFQPMTQINYNSWIDKLIASWMRKLT